MPDEMTYSYTPSQREGTMVLKLVGPLTLSTMFGFQNEFRLMTPQVLVLHCSEIPYMDSAGLGLLMNHHVSGQDHGRKLLLAGVNERIAELFKMTKVDGVLSRFSSVAAAEESL
jgi:anti-sigma B factor antagonist